MELYEKIIIASAMGLYLCFLIYQNRDYFVKNPRSKAKNNKKDNTEYETIKIETEDKSDASIEIKIPKDKKDNNNDAK